MGYYHNIHTVTFNDKGRYVQPSDFRNDPPIEIVESNIYVSPSENEGCLIARPEPEWNKFIESIQLSSMDKKNKRKLIRGLNALVQKTRMDKQNRIFLNQKMRNALKLNDQENSIELTLVGAGSYFEIWNNDFFDGEDNILAEVINLQNMVDEIDNNEIF